MIVAVSTASFALLAACILADAPPTIEVPAPQRPVIVNAAAIPKLGEIIDDPRSLVFAVTVEVDSDQPLRYLVLIDFDELNPKFPSPSSLEPTPGISRRTVEFDYTQGALDPTTCHKIRLVVALEFDRDTPYAPKKPPGGDVADWIYQPRGVSCGTYDAGPLPEAGSDAADGAADGGLQ